MAEVNQSAKQVGAQEVFSFTVPPEAEGVTIYDYLRRQYGVSRGLLRRLRTGGQVLVDGSPTRLKTKLAAGSIVRLVLFQKAETGKRDKEIREMGPAADNGELGLAFPATEGPLTEWVVYEDSHLLVVNKPAGVVVHPTRGYATGTLVQMAAAYLAAAGDAGHIHPVHRLDRPTSGLIVLAKDPHSHHRLAGKLHRTYLAVVEGAPQPAEGLIEGAVARDPMLPTRRAVVAGGSAGGRASATRYRTMCTWVVPRDAESGDGLGRGRLLSVLEVQPLTGRTHQIRTHLAASGHPLAGDVLYGGAPLGTLERPALHAWKLAFPHPITGAELRFSVPCPPDLAIALFQSRCPILAHIC